MKIKVKNKPHYIVARIELVYEEFNCHRTDEHNAAQGRRGKRRIGENYNEGIHNS
jgi:hypothetical protein